MKKPTCASKRDMLELATLRYASSRNDNSFSKSYSSQTYQYYQQSRQKLETFLGNKVFQNNSVIKVGLKVWYLKKNQKDS